MSAGLFPEPARVEPAVPIPDGISRDARRTLRQRAELAAGRHPLGLAWRGTLALHPTAAPANDKSAPGARCGNCLHRSPGGEYRWPGCDFYRSRSAASDVRAWWPACIRWEAKP